MGKVLHTFRHGGWPTKWSVLFYLPELSTLCVCSRAQSSKNSFPTSMPSCQLWPLIWSSLPISFIDEMEGRAVVLLLPWARYLSHFLLTLTIKPTMLTDSSAFWQGLCSVKVRKCFHNVVICPHGIAQDQSSLLVQATSIGGTNFHFLLVFRRKLTSTTPIWLTCTNHV